MSLTLKELKSNQNVADLLEESVLNKIGADVVKNFEIDEDSRADWKELVDKAMAIAKQTMETKNHPFPGAANVKYPLITRAAIDFAARTYPEMIQNDRVVKTSVVGQDLTNEKQLRATRVSRHMSYQLLHVMEDWETGVDRMLHILPILGTVFKKTYYNPLIGQPVSELCLPEDIVINDSTKSLKKARRISHILTFHMNDIIERIRANIYSDVDLNVLRVNKTDNNTNLEDEDAPLELIEQHCYLDLDEDGYQEPYIVTVHKSTRKVLRIVSRFKSIKYNAQGEVKFITPEHYFVDFHFIRSPDGGYYSVGLGTLLYPLNETINTLINQLLDSGTLNNSQGGFLGKGLRLKAGEFRLKLGEWKILDASSGTNLAQNIVPLPTKEPSDTLLKLLTFLVEAGKDLIFATDTLQGKGQTQNVAATTVQTLVEQGMKIYNAINKRLYLSLSSEYNMIYELNYKYLKNEEYQKILDDPLADVKADYDCEGLDVLPVSDPNMATDVQRIAKAQAIMSLPTVDPMVSTKYLLQALQVDDKLIEQLVPPRDPNAPPPPDVQKIMAEAGLADAQTKLAMMTISQSQVTQAIEIEKNKVLQKDAAVREAEAAARIMKMQQDSMINTAKVQISDGKETHKALMSEIKQQTAHEKTILETQIKGLNIEKDIKIAKEKNTKGE